MTFETFDQIDEDLTKKNNNDTDKYRDKDNDKDKCKNKDNDKYIQRAPLKSNSRDL